VAGLAGPASIHPRGHHTCPAREDGWRGVRCSKRAVRKHLNQISVDAHLAANEEFLDRVAARVHLRSDDGRAPCSVVHVSKLPIRRPQAEAEPEGRGGVEVSSVTREARTSGTTG
jgi:hypothetical protein